MYNYPNNFEKMRLSKYIFIVSHIDGLVTNLHLCSHVSLGCVLLTYWCHSRFACLIDFDGQVDRIWKRQWHVATRLRWGFLASLPPRTCVSIRLVSLFVDVFISTLSSHLLSHLYMVSHDYLHKRWAYSHLH